MTGSLREILIWFLCWLLPLLGGVILAQLFLYLPAKRHERARLFLDLLETAIQTGQSPERAIISISETRERSVSPHFHLLAADIEEGATLAQGLGKVTSLLPPNIAESVRIGAEESTLPQMIVAARAMLVGTKSRMRGALNYVVVFMIVLLPAALAFLPFLSMVVWPKLKAVMEDIEVPPPLVTQLVFENMGYVTLVEGFVLAGILFFAFFYISGPGASRLLNRFTGGWVDRWLFMIPWRRNRIHRDFTGALGVLLDADVNESRAVQLAARATANEIFQRRAQRTCERLRAGETLPEAIQSLESSAEFQWRWANALRAGKGFFACLRGWHESLEARAFQQEQAAAHVISTFIVILNGALVGALAAAVFLIFITIVEEGTLW